MGVPQDTFAGGGFRGLCQESMGCIYRCHQSASAFTVSKEWSINLRSLSADLTLKIVDNR